MQKTKLLVALLGALGAMPALAADAPAAPYTITGNVGFTSDYVYNGISQNYRTPALQGGFDFNHSNGLYLGTWASNISGNQYTNASMEWDLYAGYNGKINDDLSYSAGLMEVVYPGGRTSSDPANNSYKKWDTTEIVVGATWKGVNIKYTHTLTDWYGINTDGYAPTMWEDNSSTANDTTANSKGSGYIEMNYSYEIADKLVATAHAGHQKIKNFDKLSYSDIKLALSKEVAGFVLGAAYTKTNATDNNLYHVIANGDDKVLSGSIVAVSVTRSF